MSSTSTLDMKRPSPERGRKRPRRRSRRLSSGRWARSAATILVRADREKNTSTVTANWLERGAVRAGGPLQGVAGSIRLSRLGLRASHCWFPFDGRIIVPPWLVFLNTGDGASLV